MKVLFITYDFPYPTNSGGKNRSYHLIKHTAKKADIFLFSFVRGDYDAEYNKELLNLGVKKIKVFKRQGKLSFSNFSKAILTRDSIFKSLYYDKSVEEEILSFVKEEKIDVVHFESSYPGFYINEGLRSNRVKKILGTENIEYLLYQDLADKTNKIFLKPIIREQAKRLKREELLMVKNANFVTTVTEGESDILYQETGVRSFVIANGIEPDNFSYEYKKPENKNILFVGNFSYFPNVDGINYFLNEVFDRLPKDIKLTIVGRKSSHVVRDNPRIEKKEFVENIIEEYRNADAMIFPIRIGGGTNFKVLEAMSLGLPIIAEPERLSGLKAISNEHFLSAHTSEEYQSQLERVYSDKKVKKITENARKLIVENFSWDVIGRELLKVWNK